MPEHPATVYDLEVARRRSQYDRLRTLGVGHDHIRACTTAAELTELHDATVLRADCTHLGVDCATLLERMTADELRQVRDAAIREIGAMRGSGPGLHGVITAIAGARPGARGPRVRRAA